jgi:hypothetical protein
MVEGGELRAQKRCGSKPPSTAPHSRSYKMAYLRAGRGHPLGIKPRCDPEKKRN